MPALAINTDAAKQHAKTLLQMHRSVYPAVIRQTLNSAAYDAKKNTIPASTNVFIHRKPTFFKANSGVDVAQGFDVNTMKAAVGFISKGDKKNHSIEDLEQQEYGGPIKDRSFIPLAGARVGNTMGGNVASSMQLKGIINKIIDPDKMPGATDKLRFYYAALKAGVGGFVLSTDHTLVLKITSLSSGAKAKAKGGQIGGFVKYKVIMSVKKHRSVMIQPTHFMQKATIQSAGKMEGFFIANAEKKINSLK